MRYHLSSPRVTEGNFSSRVLKRVVASSGVRSGGMLDEGAMLGRLYLLIETGLSEQLVRKCLA